MSGTLSIVATPIGNLSDISMRALEVLRTADIIAAEDTRHSSYLLRHYAITTPTLSLHEHNEQQRSEALIMQLQQGKHVALISDAGTPLISDPGYRLVAQAHQAGIQVTPIPGACALIAALSAAGLPTDQFTFVGFLPAKGAAREQALQRVLQETRTLVLYESTHRIVSLMQAIAKHVAAERRVAIARELTKKFETIRCATASELTEWLLADGHQQKGEFVVLIEAAQMKKEEDLEYTRVLSILLKDLPLKQAVALAAKLTQGNKNELYQLALEIKGQHGD